MKEGAQDLRSGQGFNHAVFFGESVDIHHIFPKAWCEAQGIKPAIYDSIINKTPLSYRTNRIVGGAAPSVYVAKLEAGGSEAPPIKPETLDKYLESHLIDPSQLRSNDFTAFMKSRQRNLLRLIEQATGQKFDGEEADGDAEEVENDDETAEASLTIVAA
jgi:hypothetical protein